MTRALAMLAAVAITLTPALLEAGNHKSKHGNNGAGASHCPPGLAKKGTGCLPPGQAKKYGRGDIIDGDFVFIDRPGRYELNGNETYFRVGDYVYYVDRETREVLDLIGAAAAVLN